MSITHWLINESPSHPQANDPGWRSTQPTSYSLSAGFGAKNVYAWAKDSLGNVSELNDSSHFSVVYSPTSDLVNAQAAVNAAKTGDTVVLNQGILRWNGTLYIPDTKKITLQGQGIGKTIVVSTSTTELINLGRSGSRITGFEFKFDNTCGCGIIAGSDSWRIDHCRFDFSGTTTIDGVRAVGSSSDNHHPVGLVYNCEFLNARVSVYGEDDIMAHRRWSEPLKLGADIAVFVEDCMFSNTANAIDCHYGGRYVFRYNTLEDSNIASHSVDGTNRAGRSWEIYNNQIIQNAKKMFTPFYLRGGTGVVFNNLITGVWDFPNITIDNARSFTPCGEGGLADGTSLWDGNTQGGQGYPARDQIGRSTDEWLWTTTKPYPPQALEAAYCWNNMHNGTPILFFVYNGCGIHIKENRDYYNNISRTGYVPFVYPHPLRTT
jgi:hypothetical protein